MQEEGLRGISHFLACNVGAVPFKFLGVPIGANPRRTNTWLKDVVDRRELKGTSIWWRDLANLGEGTKLDNGWYKTVVQKKLGKGNSIFLTDLWLGRETLPAMFRRYTT